MPKRLEEKREKDPNMPQVLFSLDTPAADTKPLSLLLLLLTTTTTTTTTTMMMKEKNEKKEKKENLQDG